MTRPVSIRRSLLVNILLVILLLSSAIMAATFIASRETVRTLSASIMSRTIDHIEARLKTFFDPAIRELQLARAWGESGVLDLSNPEKLGDIFTPLIKEHHQVSSLMVADTHGSEYMLLKTQGKWFNRQVHRETWGNRTKWEEWSESDTDHVITWKNLDYDSRKRPWYIGAIKKHSDNHGNAVEISDQTIHWTEPYTFFTTKEPGITASITYTAPDGEIYVIGFDILLSDITKFTTSLDVSAHGKVAVMTDDGRMIGLPAADEYLDTENQKKAFLKRPEELGIALAMDAARALTREDDQHLKPTRFLSEGNPWWGQVRRYSLTSERNLLSVVMVPESDLLDGLTQIRWWIVLVTLGTLAIAVMLAITLAQRYSRPIEILVKQSHRISRGDLYEGEPVVSTIKEVRHLATAQERMRLGLQSLMKLERDIQLAQQIQQNTFPDALPEIKGFDIDAWNKPAEETGGDTYDIIGYQIDQKTGINRIVEKNIDEAIFLLADATGHGIGPALSVTQVRSMLRMAVRMSGQLEHITCHLNEQLCADLHAGRFVTAWLGKLDTRTAELTSFSAGQAPLFYFSANKQYLETMNADTPPLGIINGLELSTLEPITLSQGDIFAVFSDGIFDAKDKSGNKFGVERVKDLILEHRLDSAATILNALREALVKFEADTVSTDDQTAIIIKRN